MSSRALSFAPTAQASDRRCVDEIAKARMAKKQRMRWFPQGAHRIAVVRAAVLDGRLKPDGNCLLAV